MYMGKFSVEGQAQQQQFKKVIVTANLYSTILRLSRGTHDLTSYALNDFCLTLTNNHDLTERSSEALAEKW